MRRTRQLFSATLLVALTMTTMSSGLSAFAQQRAYRATYQQVDQLLGRIESRSTQFRQSLDAALDRTRIDSTRQEDNINEFVRAFETATINLRDRFRARRDVAADVSEVLNRAARIDSFMTRNNLGQAAEGDWRALRSDLDVLAGYYNVDWRWDAPGQSGPSGQQRPYRVTYQQVDQLLGRIETRSTQFRQSLDAALDRTRIDRTRQEDNINEFVRAFETATINLRDRFRARRDVAGDVSEVLNRAARIDSFMTRNNLGQAAEGDWRVLRSDLDVLAGYYSVDWRWDVTPPRTGGNWPGRNPEANLLTGTYRLDTARSDNVWKVAGRATRGLTPEERERLRQRISNRLSAPEMLAIERRGRNISLASSLAPVAAFEADGRERVETTARGRTVRVKASLIRDQLIVSSTGERGNDFTVTFDGLGTGQQLRVTRRMDIEQLTQPVTVNSYYDKTSEMAQLDLYTGTPPIGRNPSGPSGGRDGADLVAVLNNGLSSRQTREGELFTMTVRSPSIYDGAVIEGHVSRVERSSRLTGREQISFSFDRIRMRNGSTRPFDGYIVSVRTRNGDDVRVDNEGTVSEETSQTKETVTRTGIGAALGALLGAIAGGGKGAAVGAGVGGGVGAGSVFIQGRDNLELVSGTEFTIRAATPLNRNEPGR